MAPGVVRCYLVNWAKIAFWTLNIPPIAQLVRIGISLYAACTMLTPNVPGYGGACAVYFALGGGFPLAVTVLCALLGAAAAFAFRSRLGASTASALAAFAVAHFVVVGCVAPPWPGYFGK